MTSRLFASFCVWGSRRRVIRDRKSTRLNSSHRQISYAAFCLKKKIVATLDNVQRQIGSEEARHTGHVRRVSIVRTAAHRPKGRGAGKSEKSTLTLLFGGQGRV